MVKIGFQDSLLKLMMECITTTSYSVLINGEPHGDIIPTKGLCQGDPLFPYLFLMYIEGLHKVATKGDFWGVSIYQNEPKLIHLFFFFCANDSLIFFARPRRMSVISYLISWLPMKELQAKK